MRSMDKRESVNKISFFLILFAVIGVSVSSRNFAKLHVGPFYMLDLIFFIWLLFAVLSGQGRDITKSLKILIVPALFFSWGMVWLVCDVYKAISNVDPISMARIAQHTI